MQPLVLGTFLWSALPSLFTLLFLPTPTSWYLSPKLLRCQSGSIHDYLGGTSVISRCLLRRRVSVVTRLSFTYSFSTTVSGECSYCAVCISVLPKIFGKCFAASCFTSCRESTSLFLVSKKLGDPICPTNYSTTVTLFHIGKLLVSKHWLSISSHNHLSKDNIASASAGEPM